MPGRVPLVEREREREELHLGSASDGAHTCILFSADRRDDAAVGRRSVPAAKKGPYKT
jgi:hypothetical protein